MGIETKKKEVSVKKAKNSWYAVKSYYAWEASGKAVKIDKAYTKNSMMIEERVVLFRCENFEKALSLAEAEAKKYCSLPYKNPYNETITYKLVGNMEAFHLYDKPGHGTEVFSQTEFCKTKQQSQKKISFLKNVKQEPEKNIYRKRFGHN